MEREIKPKVKRNIENDEILKLWNRDFEPVKKKNNKKSLPEINIPKPEKTEEKKFWKEYMEDYKLKALKNDLKNIEKKEEKYRKMGDNKMLEELSELKKLIKEEIKEREKYDA